MPQKSIEIILFRQLVTYLALPSFIVDSDGCIIYCNEAAEKVLNFTFSENSGVQATRWQAFLTPRDKQGRLISIEKSPLYIASTHYCLAHNIFYFTDAEKKLKKIEIVAIPILNHMDTFLGTIAFLQEMES